MPFRPDLLDGVALPWLVTVRWAGVLAQFAAVLAGAQGLPTAQRVSVPLVLVGLSALSNLWLSWRLSRRAPVAMTAGGWLVVADVAILSWLLHGAGGVLNPVSIFYLVYIVLAALVLDRVWGWVITALSIAGYGLLFVAPPNEVAAATSMHPEIGFHVRGMWQAFAATALIVAILVSRLASLIARRDRALAELQERATRDARLAAMSTLAAGAAHELSTPLGTIAVAARELERSLESVADPQLRGDATLIRGEVERCRRLLHDMAGRFSEPLGEGAESMTVATLLDATIASLPPGERPRVVLTPSEHISIPVRWPPHAVRRALVNVLRNALQASREESAVVVSVDVDAANRVRLQVVDTGEGMTPEVLARAGEPFYTTKPQGEGTGLGLFVARSTVEQLGGSLAFDSRPGSGTAVTITLPPSPSGSTAP